ncbi:hypothetical protein BZA70DRAFT_276488 [Myxozyma melibiosi]|uniref:Uncharacterized protein n=1 Tax=Myxozyma melibiosi TaxID=54550 RepID=A0ABR1F963_9ASCO
MPDNDPHPRAQTSSCDPMSASASASVYFTSPLSASLADASSVVVTATCSSEHWTDSLPVLCPADSHSSQFMWIPTLCCCSRHSRSPPSSSSSSQHLPSELHLSKELAALWRPPSHTSHFLTPTSRHIIRFNNRTSSAFHYAPVFHGPLTDIEYPALLFTAFVVDLEREVSLSADEVLRLPRGEVPRMVWRRCRMRASDSIQVGFCFCVCCRGANFF